MNSENDGEVKIIVHLTVLDDEVNLLSQSNQHEDVSSDIEITISRGARIAELKSILESQDLLPGADGIASDDQPIPVVEIRLTPASDLLNDDDCIPKEVTNVNVVVRHSPIRDVSSPTPLTDISTFQTTPILPSAASSFSSSLASAPSSLSSSFLSPSPPFFPVAMTSNNNNTLMSNPMHGLPPSLISTLMNSPLFQSSTQQQQQQLMSSNLTEELMNDPQMMRSLMNSPMVRSMMSNPDLLRSLMDANPQMKELRERNPELNHLLNDPELLRQSMEAIQNPSLMREMIQNTDRALSNIDAIPGGFNALRRVYQQIQEPIWDAALGPDHQKNRDDNKVKFYDLRIDEKPSVEAIPNPWARREPQSITPSLSTSVSRQPPPSRSSHVTSLIPVPVASSSSLNELDPLPHLLPLPQPSIQPSALLESTTVLHDVSESLNDVSSNHQEANQQANQETHQEEKDKVQSSDSPPLCQLPNSDQISEESSSSSPAYSFQSFFNYSNPYLRLRSLGGMSLPNTVHISGVVSRQQSESSQQQPDEEDGTRNENLDEDDQKRNK